MRSIRLITAVMLLPLPLGMSAAAFAQPNPVPGAPSQPLSPAALANGVQNRITYQYGTEFVTIGAPGNAPYTTANPNDFVNGRGGVNYEYRIGRYEVTTSQWVEFFNAAFDRPANDRLPHLIPPDAGHWGAVPTTPTVAGGLRWTVPAGNEMRAVGDISWRMAAMYCNFLHNDKATNREAFLNGAYDVSTFGYFGNIFTDQLTHNANARFWIPTWDEQLKAAHFDPNKGGEGAAGWWQYNITSDTAPVYGPPETGQANAGFTSPNPFLIPLGAYAAVQSPWGLLDTTGGTAEWTESIVTLTTMDRYRVFDGSHWIQSAFQASLQDRINGRGDELPHIATLEFGLRVAAVVPSPATLLVLAPSVWYAGTCASRRRRLHCSSRRVARLNRGGTASRRLCDA